MRLPFFILLVLGAAGMAAEAPKGFVGIPWGASPEEAKRALQARPGVKFPEDSDDYHIELTGGTFAGQPVEKWVLEFPERKFGSAAVKLKTDGNAASVYNELRTQLVSKYGSAPTVRKLSSVSGKKNAVYTPEPPGMLGSIAIWKFPPTMKEKSTVVVSIELSGGEGRPVNDGSQLLVTLRYVNESLVGITAASSAAEAKPVRVPVKKEDL
ncbi:MAG: hypothetical protein ABMA01_09205 [Chthoniobacteraceae bacterium]